MADNRIYLVCSECGEMLYLGKRLGAGYWWWNYGKENNETHKDDPNYRLQDERPLEDRLNEFFAKHDLCGDLDPFKIVYEMGDDYDKYRDRWERVQKEGKEWLNNA